MSIGGHTRRRLAYGRKMGLYGPSGCGCLVVSLALLALCCAGLFAAVKGL
jgi:hypothetical protein